MAEIGSFTSRAHAEMAAGMLDAHGVRSDVMADDAGGALPHVAVGSHGYRLRVADTDVQEAEALLEDRADEPDVAGDATGTPASMGSMNRAAVVRMVAGATLAVLAFGVLVGMLT